MTARLDIVEYWCKIQCYITFSVIKYLQFFSINKKHVRFFPKPTDLEIHSLLKVKAQVIFLGSHCVESNSLFQHILRIGWFLGAVGTSYSHMYQPNSVM